MHACVQRHVHGVVLVQSAQVTGDRIDVIDDLVRRQVRSQVRPQVGGQSSVRAAQKEGGEEPCPAVPVHRHHCLHMAQESRECGGLVGGDLVRGDVPFQVVGQEHAVVTRTGPLRSDACDGVGDFLELATVERHEPEGAAQHAFLSHPFQGEEIGELHGSGLVAGAAAPRHEDRAADDHREDRGESPRADVLQRGGDR